MAADSLEKFHAASSLALVMMTAAREMFGKSYFALGVQEKTAVENAAIGLVNSGIQTLTPQFLQGLEGAPAVKNAPGFQPLANAATTAEKK